MEDEQQPQTDPTPLAEAPEQPEQPVQPEQVTPDQLCDYLTRAQFPTTLGRRGYQQDEVDALLDRLTESVRAGEPLRDLVRRARFRTTRLANGYEMTQVDDFLDAVVDLDPHAGAERPDLGRSGLVAKLFG